MAERERTPYGVERTVLRHPRLGKLTWNARVRWWEGEVPGHPEAVFFVDGTEAPEPGFVGAVHDRLTAALAAVPAAVARAEADLGSQARTGWTGDQRSVGDVVTLSSVALRADGTPEVWLDAGLLFQGDGVVVVLDAANTPTEARLTEVD